MEEQKAKWIVGKTIDKKRFNVFVFIFYDFSSSTFMDTAKLLRNFYCTLLDNESIMIKTMKWKNLFDMKDTVEKKFDNIIIHYIGHGNGIGDDRWPIVACEQDEIKLHEFVSDLPTPNKQLIFDCCNFAPVSLPSIPSMSAPALHLLLDLNGFNIISSSRKGIYSYYLVDHYTLFYFAFHKVFSGRYININDALTDLNNVLIKLYKQHHLGYQQGNPIMDSTIPFEGKIYDLMETTLEIPKDDHKISQGITGFQEGERVVIAKSQNKNNKKKRTFI